MFHKKVIQEIKTLSLQMEVQALELKKLRDELKIEQSNLATVNKILRMKDNMLNRAMTPTELHISPDLMSQLQKELSHPSIFAGMKIIPDKKIEGFYLK